MLMKPQHKLPPFDEPSFWETLSRYAKRAGYRMIETCLLLYYVSQKETLPLWVKVLIYSALAYFVMPIDVIPDQTNRFWRRCSRSFSRTSQHN